MSSILTNTSAMTALQTLKGINKNLSMIQEQVSTGKKINSAKDNAGIWAVSRRSANRLRSAKRPWRWPATPPRRSRTSWWR
jgi:flagellin